jgi:tetratricopeptide (TPR) repeat protein
LFRDLSELFLEADPEEFGDFLLDISEALMKNNGHEAALPFLQKLIRSVNYGEAAVWLQYADCLHAAGRLEQAEEAFRQAASRIFKATHMSKLDDAEPEAQ